MTEGALDYLGKADWRKRIHQLKRELRSNTSKQSLTIPEQPKAYGTELRPKRILPSDPPLNLYPRASPHHPAEVAVSNNLNGCLKQLTPNI